MLEQGPVTLHVNMFKATDYPRGVELAMGRMIGVFYGLEGLRFYRDARSGKIDPRAIIGISEGVNDYFFQQLPSVYGLPEGENLSQFYLRAQKHAVQVTDVVRGKALPSARQRTGLRVEVSLYRDTPSYLLKLMSYPDPNGEESERYIDTTLRFEVVRHLLLSHLAGEFGARSLRSRVRSALSIAQELLDDRLYSPPIGKTRFRKLEVGHNVETNTALGLRGDYYGPQSEVCLKSHLFQARSVLGIGEVYTYVRKKKDEDAILKAIAKAAGNGGSIKPSKDVTDELGIMFVAMDGEQARDKLTDRVLAVLEDHPRGVNKIEEDPNVDNDRGQNQSVRFRRFLVKLNGIDVPLELMFYSPIDYLNSEFEVGEKNVKTGFYNGRGHDLYWLRRNNPSVEVLFPECVYGVNVRQVMLDQAERVAKRLRGVGEYDIVKTDARRWDLVRV